MEWLQNWWAWAVLAIVLVFLEVLAPAYLFLGLAISAAIMSVLYMVFSGLWIGGSVFATLLIFAGLALIASISLRMWFKPASDQVKTIEHDIND